MKLDDKKLEEEILRIVDHGNSDFINLSDDEKLNLATQFAYSLLLKYNIKNLRKHKVINIVTIKSEHLSPELVRLNGEKSLSFTFDNDIDIDIDVDDEKTVNIEFCKTDTIDKILSIKDVKKMFEQ